MTQSPVIPQVMPNLEFIEHYLDSLENLPLDVQRVVSQIREYDLLYKSKLDTMGRYLCLYQSETSGPSKRKYLDKIQRCLIKSQHYGDMKLNLISQIVDLVDSRSQQLIKDAQAGYLDRREEEERRITNHNNSSMNNRVKVEKSAKPVMEKPSAKNIYDKPKRVRRVRAVEKPGEKNQRGNNVSRASNKVEEEEEDEPMEDENEDEPPEVKPKKETKKSKDREAKNKDKEKEKVTTEKDDKEDKKIERKEKHTSGKVTKKTNNKLQSKLKKQKKKKEKEIVPEDIAIDPDEPTYCICNRISYGDMIGCDNESCVIEWFHFDCVNLTHKPKGKWYCPRCTAERKEKSKK